MIALSGFGWVLQVKENPLNSIILSLQKIWALHSVGAIAIALAGCDQTNPNDYPVSHYLKDGEDCTRASAAAIIKSGLPFPNYGIEEEPATTAGAKPKRHIKTVDMWLGDVRFVIPAEVAATDGGYPAHHPRRYQALHGSLPNFYPPGPRGEEIDGMGSRVDVTFKCSMDPKYAATWGKGYRSNEEGSLRSRRNMKKRSCALVQNANVLGKSVLTDGMISG